MVASGKLRHDSHYRINVIGINLSSLPPIMPPFPGDDIPQLIDYLIEVSDLCNCPISR